MKDNDTNWIIFIILLTGFCLGFIVAKEMYDNTPITSADMYEINQTQWYE